MANLRLGELFIRNVTLTKLSVRFTTITGPNFSTIFISFLKTTSFVESRLQLMDDQLINRRIDRIRRKRGPKGRAKPT